MPKLIARKPILCSYEIGIRKGNHQFQPGDELPEAHPDAEAWVESGAAFWRPDDYEPPTYTRAKLTTAAPGLPGLAAGGGATGNDLVGRVPITEQRRRRK